MEGNERMYSNSSCCRVYWLRYWGQWSPRLAICCLCVCTGVTATPTLWMSNSSTTALSLSQCCYRNIFSIETFSLSKHFLYRCCVNGNGSGQVFCWGCLRSVVWMRAMVTLKKPNIFRIYPIPFDSQALPH